MANEDTTSTISEADIEAALAEAEAETADIPSLDDGSGQKVVHIPVESTPRAKTPSKPLPTHNTAAHVVVEPQSEPTELGSTEETEAVSQTHGRLHALIHRVLSMMPQRLRRRRSTAPGAEPAADPHGVSHILYRSLDTTLWALNRPFQWMSPEVRRLTGILAIVTIATSLLALYLLPLLYPPRDPISQLNRESGEIQAEMATEYTTAPQ